MRAGPTNVQSFLQCLSRLTVRLIILHTGQPHLCLSTWTKDQHLLFERSALETSDDFFPFSDVTDN